MTDMEAAPAAACQSLAEKKKLPGKCSFSVLWEKGDERAHTQHCPCHVLQRATLGGSLKEYYCTNTLEMTEALVALILSC